MDTSEIVKNICSYNVNGLGTIKKKRVEVFKWLKRNFAGIIFLQETHSTLKEQSEWRKEIGHQYFVYFSHGDSNSRGVCTLIPKQIHKFVTCFHYANIGRTLIINFNIEGKEYVLINVYFPTQNHVKDQMAHIDYLDKCVDKFGDTNYIIGGDFNIVLNPKMDKWGGENESPSKAALYLKSFLERNNIIDIWRTLYPDKKQYTWRRKNPMQQSRIDLWCISDQLIYNVTDSVIELGIRSDHSTITLNLKLFDTTKPGKSYWKFNNSLLEDKLYVDLINSYLLEQDTELDDIIDKRLAWEILKMKIRRMTITFSIRKSKVF